MFIKNRVEDSGSAIYGRVEDVVLEPSSGKIVRIVVRRCNGTRIELPYSAVGLDRRRGVFVLERMP